MALLLYFHFLFYCTFKAQDQTCLFNNLFPSIRNFSSLVTSSLQGYVCITFTHTHSMTGRKIRALQVPPIVPNKALGNFPQALYGRTRDTYSAHVFHPVMEKSHNNDCSFPRRVPHGFMWLAGVVNSLFCFWQLSNRMC